MYYNVEFFFEKPYRLFTSEEETQYSVTLEEFELYNSGKYVKGSDGRPKLLEQTALSISVESYSTENLVGSGVVEEIAPAVSNDQIMSALSELSETMAQLIGDKDD